MGEKKQKKILILGMDGMDPRLTRTYVDRGLMPNVQRYIERGAQREDLVLLGGLPTVTPSMWTTLTTGAYPMTHGITDFYRQNKESLAAMDYNLDSRLCTAEPLWNVFAEAGKKTLVWHWPGSAWPPTSDSPNLHVVDGSSPGGVNMSNSQLEPEFIVSADVNFEQVTFQEKGGNEVTPCAITDLEVADADSGKNKKNGIENTGANGISCIILKYGEGAGSTEYKLDVALSPIKPASKWASAQEGAKEFIMLLSHGLIRRPCQIWKNEAGIYDQVAVFKSKKEEQPMCILKDNELTEYVLDEAIKNDKTYQVIRHMRIFELDESGERLKIWISAAMDIDNDTLWHPKSLYKAIGENVGYPPPSSMLFAAKSKKLFKCMVDCWNIAARWQAAAIQYAIKEENYEVVFSHFHSLDLQKHTFYKYLIKGWADSFRPEEGEELLKEMYVQADHYLGSFLHLLDEDWTIFIVSDHAVVATDPNLVPLLGDMNGVNVGVMRELGFTEVKKDADGNDLKEIDWSRTKAIANRGVHIYLNLKGRDKYGIVEPKDQYQVEEEIITGLYGYKHPVTGHRIVALALRNKDAVLLGLGGPECGDIIYFIAEGYNYDHTDSLSTAYGSCGTSVSPIFIAAGKGLREGFTTPRVIREVDVAPTVAVLGGVRMPEHCEGAPVYQILEDAYKG